MSRDLAASEFLPLPMAAAVTYFRLVEHQEREPSSDGLLDVVSSALSVWIPIYGGQPRTRLSDDQVARGRFCNGATQLRFRDGTPPLENLAILQCDLETALLRLQQAGVRFSHAIIETAPRRLPRVQPRTG